jgi:predicted YcjX-like family ATPase
MLHQATKELSRLAHASFSLAKQAINEASIRIAVTGLSRAGKTVFITSLIHNLLALGQRRNTLPRVHTAFGVNGTSRLREVRIAPKARRQFRCSTSRANW